MAQRAVCTLALAAALLPAALARPASRPRPSPAPAHPAAASESYSRGLAALGEHSCDAAVEHWMQAVKLDPDYWEAHREIAQCRLKQGQPADAVVHLNEALRVRPGAKDLEALQADATQRAAYVARFTPAPLPTTSASSASATLGPAPSSASGEVSLGDLARKKGAKPSGSKTYTLGVSEGGGGSEASQAEREAPVSLLDSMRKRAEEVLRPRMSAVAASVKTFKAGLRRYEDACAGKTTVKRIDPEEADHYRSEARWNDYWGGMVVVVHNEETPECRALASDVDAAADHIVGSMAGADNELAMPPSVYPGIREEVFSRLADELW